MPTDDEIILGQGQIIRILRSMLNDKGISNNTIDRVLSGRSTVFEERHSEACASENHYRCNEAFPDCWCRRCHAVPEEYDNPALIDGSPSSSEASQ